MDLPWNLTEKIVIHWEWWVQFEISQEAEFKNGGDGWKMAMTATATRDHLPHTSCVAHRPELKLQAWCRQQLPFLLVRRVQFFGGQSKVNVPCRGYLLEKEEKKKKKKKKEEDLARGKIKRGQ